VADDENRDANCQVKRPPDSIADGERLRILFLQKRPLFPPTTGGHIRTLNLLRHLARWHDITYLCNVQQHEAPHLHKMEDIGLKVEGVPWKEASRRSLAFYRDLGLNLLSRYPFNVNKDYDRRLRRRAEELLRTEPFDLLICDFVQMARNAIGLPAPASILFQHNVEAQIFQRHAESDAGWLRRKYMGLQCRKMRRFEQQAGLRFDAAIAVSEQDRRTFQGEYGWEWVREIDTAVDTDYFRPSENAEASERIVFVGSLDWLPNEDGVRFFVKEVWPRIRQARPGATFQAVGRNPSRGLQRLGDVAGVEIVGTVPDVRPYLAAAAVVVVPLLVGGGTRMKIYEAMAMGKAVVSTSLGAEGLKVTPGAHLLLADAPDAIAVAVEFLLNHPPLRSELGHNAMSHVCSRFSAETVARQFDGICRETVRGRRRETPDTSRAQTASPAGRA
jgi:glycosyltransferase involved in cell wall biosynthesis